MMQEPDNFTPVWLRTPRLLDMFLVLFSRRGVQTGAIRLEHERDELCPSEDLDCDRVTACGQTTHTTTRAYVQHGGRGKLTRRE